MKQESFVLSEPRLHTLNTSVRAVAAEKTLALIQPYLEQVGVRQIIDITLAGVPACPAYQIVRDDMRSLYFNAGKGYSNVESQVSGLMEAIEVHCFERASASLLVEPGAALRTVACAALSPRADRREQQQRPDRRVRPQQPRTRIDTGPGSVP